MGFRTRKKDGQVFPTSDGKKFKQTYNEKHMRNPSWTAKHSVKSDIKEMHRSDDIENPADHTQDKKLYKKRLQNVADGEMVKQDKRQTKKQEKLIKKQQKELVKQAKQDFKNDMKEQEQEQNEAEEINKQCGG